MNLGMRTALVGQNFPPNFKHCARAEIRSVIATKFQPSGRAEISARAEILVRDEPKERLRRRLLPAQCLSSCYIFLYQESVVCRLVDTEINKDNILYSSIYMNLHYLAIAMWCEYI